MIGKISWVAERCGKESKSREEGIKIDLAADITDKVIWYNSPIFNRRSDKC